MNQVRRRRNSGPCLQQAEQNLGKEKINTRVKYSTKKLEAKEKKN
jgi:hypothetical protein